MNLAQKQFLELLHPPGRLKADQTVWRLGLTRSELRIVSSAQNIAAVRESLPKADRAKVLSEETRLRPLGNPTQSCEKFYLESRISELEKDEIWLHKALLTVRLYRRLPRANPEPNPMSKHGD
jgi:hypothetical protein